MIINHLGRGIQIPFAASLFFFVATSSAIIAAESATKPDQFKISEREDQALGDFILAVDNQLEKKDTQPPSSAPRLFGPDDVITPAFPDDQFPTDPTDPNLPSSSTDYGNNYFPFPVLTNRNGASELIAMETLYQTLMFYGVVHIVEKTGTTVNFKIVKSKNNYFANLTKLDVAFAIREFGRYLTAHLCGQATPENFYSVFSQVPAEEIGLRFKYDMAWALLGNLLPKEPNAIMKVGAKWSALQQILNASTTAKEVTNQSKDLKQWLASVTDLMGIVQRVNKMICYVDIRPDPQDELKKRVVIKKMLELQRKLKEHYDEIKQLLDPAEKVGRATQLSSLRNPSFQFPSDPGASR